MTKYGSKGKQPLLKTDVLLDKGVTEIRAVIKDVREVTFDEEEKPILDLTSGEEEFGFVLNITNTNTLMEKYGEDSDQWLDKSIVIRLEKTDYAGKRVPCLRIL